MRSPYTIGVKCIHTFAVQEMSIPDVLEGLPKWGSVFDSGLIVSYRIVSFRFVSFRFFSNLSVYYRIVSCRVVSCRVVSYRFVSYRILPPSCPRQAALLTHTRCPCPTWCSDGLESISTKATPRGRSDFWGIKVLLYVWCEVCGGRRGSIFPHNITITVTTTMTTTVITTTTITITITDTDNDWNPVFVLFLQDHVLAKKTLPPAFKQYYPDIKHTMSLTSLNACSTRGNDIPYQLSRYPMTADCVPPPHITSKRKCVAIQTEMCNYPNGNV